MTSAIDKIDNTDVRAWYQENISSLFDVFLENAKEKGYVMDRKSGLFIKPGFSSEIQERLGHTSIYIIFPRPTDLHYHEDVDEAIHVIDGTGMFYTQFEKSEREECIFSGREILVPQRRAHSFMPNLGEFLEMRIECSGLHDPKKEKLVVPFYEFRPWIEYYERIKNGNNGLSNGHFPKNHKSR